MRVSDVPEPGTGRFAILQEPKEARFAFFQSEELLKASVMRVVNPVAFDGLGHPVEGGLYDPAMGPTKLEQGPCVTCGLSSEHCPGHLGRIELCVPVYNPILFPNMYRLLGAICFNCNRFRYPKFRADFYRVKLLLLEADLVSEAVNLENALAQSGQMGASRTSADLERKFEVLSRYEALAMQTIAKADILMGRKPGYELRTTPRLPIQMSQHARLEWKETVRDFFAKMPLTCSSCGVLKPTLRKDAFAKIFIRHRGKTKSAVKRASKKSKRKEDNDEEDLDELDENGENEALIGKEIYLHPIEVRGQLENLWKNHASLCSRIWGRQRGGMPNAKGYSSFFSQIVPVPPSRFRPPAMMNGMTFEHPQNVALNKVLRLDEDLRQVFKTQAEKDREEAEKKKKKKKKDKEKSKKKKVKESKKRNDSDESNSESDSSSQSESSSSSESSEDEAEEANKQLTELDAKSLKDEETLTTALNIWVDLQDAVNAFIDGTKSKEGARAPPGVRQGLEKKEGLFRQNMMGKRVNYAARSVISPDPYIGTDEVGLPVRFATKLSYPEPVTRFNAKELAQMVRNGPNVHPGALYVENEDGKLIDLSRQTERQRDNLAAQLEQFNSFALVEEQSVRASRFLPSESNGVFRREHNQQHAPLTLRKQKKVWRHARSGDFMLANRQPTLHKPSLMAHKVRVINNPAMQTIRLHYANCNSYNADFDGDEINLHLPQSELCRAEAYEIAYTNQQYCSTTDGSPLRGLIQDHVGMGVMLTKRNTFLTKEEYCQMVFVACASMNSRSAEIKLVPPAILFPRQLWTGKQVITTIIQHLVGSDDPTELLTMGPGKTKIPALAWVPKQPPPKSAREKRISDLIGESDGFLSETKVILRQGVLCTGVLDKAQFGASEYGLVHSIYELYGANAAGEILSSFGRLFTFCAQKWGHTCAIEDLLLNPDAERFRTKTIEESVVKGIKLSAEFAGIEDYEETKYSPEAVATALEHRVRVAGRKEDEAILDSAMQGVTSEVTTEIIDECLPKGLRKPFPKNCFSLMVYSGAKGSMVNQSQVSCALGQQALEGRRVPRSIAGKSLPCFSPFDPTPRAGGYVSDRFLTGVRPQEYYFHCMAGREGLIDTAVKTANSGYLQRCLIKHLENVSVAYDRTVRQTDGSVLQFQYGGDGLDALNTSYLNGSLDTLGFLYSNVPALVKRLRVGNGRGELDLSRDDGVLDMNKALELHNLIKKTIKKSAKLPKGHTALFAGCLALARRPKRQDGSSSMTEEALSLQLERARVVRTNRDSGTVDLIFEKDGALVEKVPVSNERTQNVFGLLPDPVMSSLSPDTHLGAVNECLQGKLDEYIAENPHGLLKDEDDDLTLQQLIWIKYLRSLAAPGENVGVIAGQSVGEPSTQMTLNTFHLAGHGAGNVTLGIPRLRELLMTASVNIKTPTMSLPLLPSVSKRDAEKLNSSLYCLRLSELLRLSTGGIRVVETMCRKSQNSHKLHKYTAAALMCRKEKGAGEWIREYSVELLFQPMEVISAEFGLTFEELIKKVAVNFCPEFAKAITTEMRRSGGKTLKRISAQDKEDDEENESKFDMNNGANDATKKKKNKSGDDSDDSDDDSDEDSEGENETLRLGRQKEVDGYEDDSDAESSSDDERPSQTKSEQQQKKKEGESSTKEDDEDVDEEIALLNGGGDSVMVRGRRVRFVHVPLACRSLSAWATTSSTEESKDGKLAAKMTIRLRFPASEKKLLMVGIAEAVAEKCVIQSVKGIEASFVVEKKEDKSLVIQTKGCNLATAWELADRVDVNRLDSNDIGAFLNTYGVEAARAAIVKEVKNVFGVYGIGVDERHLGLIADYMTHEGGYKAFNRTGINSATSPFVRMTFETSANFLLASALEGEVDALDSTSARLCVGQLLRSGTGAFDVMVPNALTPDVELSVDAPVHTDGREKKKKAKKEKKEKKEKKHKKSRD